LIASPTGQRMQWLNDKVQRLALLLLLLGAVGMIISMFLGVADVVGTKFFGLPVPGALEVTESTMVLIVFGALAYTQARRGHIRVELLYNYVGPRMQSFMEATTHFFALLYFALLAWQGFHELLYSWEIREATMGTIRFPLYPARLLLFIGTALLLVQLGLDLIVDLGRIRRGEAPPAPPGPTPDGGELPQGS
jgi:TRAP-type mannitol/chloroaromatic compound transport system permease small subunit